MWVGFANLYLEGIIYNSLLHASAMLIWCSSDPSYPTFCDPSFTNMPSIPSDLVNTASKHSLRLCFKDNNFLESCIEYNYLLTNSWKQVIQSLKVKANDFLQNQEATDWYPATIHPTFSPWLREFLFMMDKQNPLSIPPFQLYKDLTRTSNPQEWRTNNYLPQGRHNRAHILVWRVTHQSFPAQLI